MKRTHLIFSLCTLFLAWGFVEFISAISLYFLKTKSITYAPLIKYSLSKEQRELIRRLIDNQAGYFSFDSELGWSITPSIDNPWLGSNSIGIRATHEYSLKPDSKVLRIAAFGDSFTHGNDVKNTDTWTERLEQFGTHFEVMNFGVSGYGVDQAFLRYCRDGTQFHPNRVFIGYMSENILRHVNTFRGFLSGYSTDALAKPRFLWQFNQLVLKSNPMPTKSDYEKLLKNERAMIPQLGLEDYYYNHRYHENKFDFLPSVRLSVVAWQLLTEKKGASEEPFIDNRYNKNSEAYKVTLELLKMFALKVKTNGSKPTVLIFPDIWDLLLHFDGKQVTYVDLKKDLRDAGVEFIDLIEAFSKNVSKTKLKPNDYFTHPFYHYNELGNLIVAKYLHSQIKAQEL